MLYNYNEVIKKFKSDYNLKKALKNKSIYKIESGIYSEQPNIHYLSIIEKKYPYAVVSGLSAYYYYGFTDVIPEKITLCTSRNSTNINNNEIKQIRMKDELYILGITSYEYEGVTIKIYNKERLLIDLVRYKNKIGYDLYKEIITNYRKIIDELDMSLIEEYLNVFKEGEKFYKILMDEVF